MTDLPQRKLVGNEKNSAVTMNTCAGNEVRTKRLFRRLLLTFFSPKITPYSEKKQQIKH